jgi:hypothetical protein
MHAAEFELAITSIKRPHTYALDRRPPGPTFRLFTSSNITNIILFAVSFCVMGQRIGMCLHE